MKPLLLVNPNTNVDTTAAMLDIARASLQDVRVEALTARFGAPLITNETALAEAGRAVLDLVPHMGAAAGVIVAAFGDPGLSALRRQIAVPATGLAEAGMAEAGEAGRRFAVVTTTPELVAAIARSAEAYGHGPAFLGTFLTPGDPREVMAEPGRLVEALAKACSRAVEAGAEAVVIGGGPLALAARALSGRRDVRLIEPLPAALRLAHRRAMEAGALA
ncbi:aspartate/glutamate racemase family protein [Ancylobacter sp. SL191]|uniref:aspartate/glutamate racemase family protein n=1 Tax=Ancylobacter sp. SL191 TaxID=2995166 RepID=UPI0022703202|nr:aspartate/glutamate racemase family protein [Ancylobacter sp. SL191]WAC26096.1 aspartate/glutamate racemase family protein [Ancylobacter sp. SL191]